MDNNIWKGKWKETKWIKKQWGSLTNDEIAELEGKQEKLADLLQVYGDSKDDADDHYTLFG